MEEELFNIKSEKVQEILGQIPGRIVRIGTSLIFVFIALLITASWFFKYPDIIRTSVVILTKNPPATIVTKSYGNIEKIFIKDNQHITPGEKLAVIENTSDFNDVFIMENLVDSIRKNDCLFDTVSFITFNTELHLGDVQEPYFTFLKNYSDYSQFFRLNYYQRKISSLHKEILKNQLYTNRLNNQLVILDNNIGLYETKYKRDSDLFTKGVIPEAQLENSKSELLMKRIQREETRSDLASNQIRITQIEQNILDNQLIYQDKKNEISQKLQESFDNLYNQLKIWEYKYLLKAPFSGTISFNKFWSINQNVVTGDKVFTIVPEKPSDIIGKADLPLRGSGKVKTGQKVNFKLENYPFAEFGIIKGLVRSVSLTPEDNKYAVEISLPEGLKTNFGKTLPLNQKMQGTAEIITEDMSLLKRIFNPLKSLFAEHIN